MFKRIVVLLSILSVAFAALSIGPLQPKPKKYENVKGCYIQDLDAVIPFGSSKPSRTSCMEYRCGETIVQYVTCGVAVSKPPCHLVLDKTAPYPECCPKIRCT